MLYHAIASIDRGSMPAARTVALFVAALAASPALAQTPPPDADAVRSGLEEIFSIATFGAVTMRDQGVQVTQSGSDYQVHMPLAGFAAPPDAAINAVAHPIERGLLDITSMTFPSAGTIETGPANGGPGEVTYTIGQQRITAKVDPTLALPSSYEAEFSQFRLHTDHGEQHAEQSLDRYTINGTLSADAGGLLTLASQGSGTGFHLIAQGANGFASDTAVRALAGHFSVEGLDRAKGARLMAAFRSASSGAKTQDQPAGASPEQRRALRAMVDAASGLLNRVEAEEVMEDVRFAVGSAGNATSGTIGRVRVSMTGDAADQRLSAQLGVTLDGISSSALTGENAAFMPHHVDLKTVLAGVRIGPLMALLRAATEPGADPAALQAQAIALLADPEARIGIDSMSFDSGPLRVTGSVKVVPRANGEPGAEVHIAASGVDALLAQAQAQPKLQRIMPMVFLAKGMGRPEGDSLVWDISLGDGPIRVNGVPFGQAPGKTR
jgi:hypothetical protein